MSNSNRVYHKYIYIVAVLTFNANANANANADADADADFVEFNKDFLSPGSKRKIDIISFEKNRIQQGTYRSNILVNGVSLGSYNIHIKKDDLTGAEKICLEPDVIHKFPLDLSVLNKEQTEKLLDDQCVNFKEIYQGSELYFDSNEQTLDVTIPAIFVKQEPRGYVNPQLWDQGITTGLLNYTANFYRNKYQADTNDYAFAGIKAGFNSHGWYFRHNGNWGWQSKYGSKYQALNTYVQKDIPEINARMIIGDSSTSGEQYDTLSFRGVQILHEEQMLPESQRGYAPTIRGVARTNARVQVFQQGRLLHELVVPPGEFKIDDLYPTGYGGNLDVVVDEADGTVQKISVPFASTSDQLRSGYNHYSATLGKLRKSWVREEPFLSEFTWKHGFNNYLTNYLGLQGNNNYQSMQIGVATGTPVGIFSFDVTHANTKLVNKLKNYGDDLSGQSYQIKYSKYLIETGSNISLAAYRYSTKGYLDYLSAMQIRDSQNSDGNDISFELPKSKLTLTLNQDLPIGWGSLYISGWQQDYWKKASTDRQYQLGYNNNLGRIRYNLSVSRYKNGSGNTENQYFLNFSLPLGNSSPFSQMSMNLSKNSGGSIGQQINLSGTGLEDKSLNYNLSAANYSNGVGSSGSINSSLRTRFTTVQGTTGIGRHYQNYSLGLNGAAVIHQDGVTLTPYSAETQALVEAKGAEGASVGGYPGIVIDRFGYAVVPFLSPYKLNEISIDPKGLPDDVELNTTSQKVAPYSGAVVKTYFDTTFGRPVLIQLTDDNKVPFAANVVDSTEKNVGVMGQGGRIFVRLSQDEGTLKVSWGPAASESCFIRFRLPPKKDGSELTMIHSECL